MFALGVVVMVACNSGSSSPSSSPPPAAQPPPAFEVRVDRRVELISILQRLVGEREYKTAPSTRYIAAVDKHFAPFSQHPAVAATRELRRKSITWDAPMHIAINLDDKLQLKAQPADPRFAGVDLQPYLASVRAFAADTRFDEFFAQHRPYYDRISERLRGAIAKQNPHAWFDTFFGKREAARFIVVPAPVNGDWNYGTHTGNDIYSIMGIMRVDFDELPVVDDATMDLVVHEMAHSYINPLFDKHHAALELHGKRLFAKVEDAMKKSAYGMWHIFMREQGVRAVTALYIHDRRGRDAANAATAREIARSFLWTPHIAKLLAAKYVAERERYVDLDAFMPELIAFLATLD